MEQFFVLYGVVVAGIIVAAIVFAQVNRRKRKKLTAQTALAVEVDTGTGVSVHAIDGREPRNAVRRSGGYVYILPSGAYVFELSHQYSKSKVLPSGSETVTSKRQKLRVQLEYGYVYTIQYDVDKRQFFFEKKEKAAE